jgi:hypothetical protein
MSNVLGLRIEASPFLTGQKTAAKVDVTVFVSPAMYDLIKHADEEELKHLLANVPVLDLGPDPFELRKDGGCRWCRTFPQNRDFRISLTNKGE